MSIVAEPSSETQDHNGLSFDAMGDDHIAFESTPSVRGDRCTISIVATGIHEPGVAQVNTLLVYAGLRPISLTTAPGVTRVTVPADSQAAALQVLHDAFVPAAA